jgi:hypothetical protein
MPDLLHRKSKSFCEFLSKGNPNHNEKKEPSNKIHVISKSMTAL